MSKDHMELEQSPGAQKVKSLHTLTTGSFQSSLSALSSTSRAIPTDKDFHFYYNFDEFKNPIQEIAKNSQSILDSIGSSAEIWDIPKRLTDGVDEYKDYDSLVDFNDEIYERLDISMDEFERNRRKEEVLGRPIGHDTENGFQVVSGKKKKGAFNSGTDMNSGKEELSGVKVAARDKHASGTGKAKIPFHIPTIRRPQDEYNIFVHNDNQPFQHVWLQRTEDGRQFHPLEKHSVLEFVEKDIGDTQPIEPPPMESTPFKIVEDVKALKALAAKLRDVNEFAVDLEHNQYRSFQGLTCLMQISTRTEDFVVDTLKLRVYVGPHLREVFKDPTKKKVMHGADRDIVWLQRDFGIYVCNLFDTGQASRVLKLERNSLEFLLQHFCGVAANKEYQNADWRLRPLPDEMLRYAREDTHYLLYMYDVMKIELHAMPRESEDSDTPLVEVYQRSYDICMQLYEKELLTENSYLYIYGLQSAGFNAEQLAIVAGLSQWRDVIARTEDESTGYILPNKTLLEIAKQMPTTAGKLRRVLKSKHPFVERNLGSLVSLIRESIQNAAAFEAVAQHLKEGRVEIASEENIDVPEVIPAENNSGVKIDNAKSESSSLGIAINGNASVHQLVGQGGPTQLPGVNGKAKTQSDSSTLVHPGEPLIVSGQSSREISCSTGLLPSAKVSGATVQILKNPSRGFGALLGTAAPKRKFGTDKESDDLKLEQIRSSVSLPFHSFSGPDVLMKPVAQEFTTTVQSPQHDASSALPASDSKLGDILLLEEDSNVEESNIGESETSNLPMEDKSAVSSFPLQDEEDDEPMSLTDLSTSFENCLQTVKKSVGKKGDKSQESDRGLQLKPFDYEAARKNVIFGEVRKEESETGEGSESKKKGNDCSGGKKKGSGSGQAQRSEESSDFGQGKRRQAFPASGNRSVTFH